MPKFLDAIEEERNRQKDLPGSEYDLTNGPNDWVAIATKYLSEASQCKGIICTKNEYEDSLIKSAAVILAALEHIDYMREKGRLKGD